MKRYLIGILCMIVLCAGCAQAAQLYDAGMFTFAYPEGWSTDSTTYAQDNTDSYEWLVDVYTEGMTVAVSRQAMPEWEGFTLAGANEQDAEAYKQNILSQYDDLKATHLESVDNAAGTVRFMLFAMEDDWGRMLNAFTIINGVEINFSMMPDGSDWAEEDERVLREMLASLVLEKGGRARSVAI